jgi:hypothetical protein
VAFSFLYRLVVALAFGGIAMAINAAMKGTLSFAGAMRLAIVAMTTSLLLEAIISLTPLSPGCFGWFLFHAVTLGYLVFGVKAVADATRPISGFPVDNPESQPTAPFNPDTLFP